MTISCSSNIGVCSRVFCVRLHESNWRSAMAWCQAPGVASCSPHGASLRSWIAIILINIGLASSAVLTLSTFDPNMFTLQDCLASYSEQLFAKAEFRL